MFLYFNAKHLYIFLITVVFTAVQTEVENGTLSINQMLDYYADVINKKIEFREFCLSADIRPLVFSDINTKHVAVIFGLTDDKFRKCFSHFDIFLVKEKKVAKKANVSANFNVQKNVSHIFENVTDGLYEVVIQPCFSDLTCANVIFHLSILINMSSINFSGMPINLNSHSQDFEVKILLIITFLAVIVILVIVGLSYHYKSVVLISRRELLIKYDSEQVRILDVPTRKIEVFISNYYDGATENKVEILKDFFLQTLERFSSSFSCLDVNFKLIGCELHESLGDQSAWINHILRHSNENDNIIKKIVLVDSAEDIQQEVNENENEIFCETIKKLSRDVPRSLEDYDNIFVIRFRRSSTGYTDFEHIVRGSRYSIPDHLIDLCLNLFHGSHAPEFRENLRQFLLNHPIINM